MISFALFCSCCSIFHCKSKMIGTINCLKVSYVNSWTPWMADDRNVHSHCHDVQNINSCHEKMVYIFVTRSDFVVADKGRGDPNTTISGP